MNTVYMNQVQHHTRLGVILSNDDTWHKHINYKYFLSMAKLLCYAQTKIFAR